MNFKNVEDQEKAIHLLSFSCKIAGKTTVDRDAIPLVIDSRMYALVYAKSKINSIVDGRLALVDAMAESKTPDELSEKIKILSSRFAYLRYWCVKPDKQKDHGHGK